MATNFIRVGPGGLCFAHGPYEEGDRCPRWPDCINDPHQPKWIEEGARQIRRSQELPKLEHELATTFIAQQKERDPAERTRLWNRCLELAKELEQLNEPQR